MNPVQSPAVIDNSAYFLSTLVASRSEKRLAGAVLLVSALVFLILAPLAKVQLEPIWGFIPCYESWIVVVDLITATLLFSQYYSFGQPSLCVLASGYLFSASMTIVHALTFPGLFAAGGLLGAGPQSTAWLYMLWHGGFPLFVVAYALLKGRALPMARPAEHTLLPLAAAGGGVLLLTTACAVLVTWGQAALPAIMQGNHYSPQFIVVVSLVWLSSALALVVLWLRRPHSVLDLWLMVVMFAWLVDIALSAALNQGRFDLGFYAGRVYGLLATSFVLLVLLAESGMLYRKLLQLTNTLHRLTLQDALSGIANRRAFDQVLDHEWRRARRDGQTLSLLMIDVDHFKAYNDHYGHAMGDSCLRAVATALQGAVTRSSDLVARYGGEEFAVLLPNTEGRAAGKVAERLRSAVADLSIAHHGASSGPQRVSISLGVASLRPTWGDTVDLAPTAVALVDLADQALYRAKAEGRDRWSAASAVLAA